MKNKKVMYKKPKIKVKKISSNFFYYHDFQENFFGEFDVILLGMGTDGHTASIFPDKIELFNSEKLCAVTEHPETGQKRITVTGKVINNAKRVIFFVTGEEKAEVVKNIIDTNYLNIGTPWNQGINIGGDYEAEYNSVFLQSFQNRTLYYHPESGLYDYNVGNATTFKRKISIASISDEEIKVNSKVDWITRGGGEFSIDLEDRFLNWRF